MRILKWLFHPVNLFIIVVLVALYINRQTLFPELSESPEVKQITNRVDSVIDTLNETVSTLSQQNTAAPAEETESVTEVVTADDKTDVPEQSAAEPATESVVSEAGDDMPQVPTVDPQDIPPQQAQSLSQPESAQPAVSEDVTADNAMQSSVSEPDIDKSGDQAKPIEVWEAARRSAWQGDSQLAIEKYRSLIAIQPDNYDAYGELGNVLLRNGDTDAAVDAYYQAALLLSQSHYPQVAWRVLDIVSRLDQKKGQELYEAMRKQQLGAAHPN